MENKDFYTVLGVERNANLGDIESAYQHVKDKARNDPKIVLAEVERAYEVLKNPNLKRKYDADLSDGKYEKYHPSDKPKGKEPEPYQVRKKRKKRLLQDPRVAIPLWIILTAVFITVLYWKVSPYLFTPTYSNGAVLINRVTKEDFGTVLDFESAHQFTETKAAPAYKLRLVSGATLWYPRDDVNKLCMPRSSSR